MSRTGNTNQTAETELTPEERETLLARIRERRQAWLLRLQIIVLGVSLGLFAKWVRDYATAAGPVSKPAVKEEQRKNAGAGRVERD